MNLIPDDGRKPIRSEPSSVSSEDTERTTNSFTISTTAGSASAYTTPNVKQEDIDALLASELNSLSINERSKIMEEIHGVEPTIFETPEFLTTSVLKLRRAIEETPQKVAYDLARSMSRYVTNDAFLLMFLRSESFEIVNTAKKIVLYMEEKMTLFGSGESLGRALCISDLDADTRTALRSGVYQYLPFRDSSGRMVVLDFGLILPKELASQRRELSNTRALFYMSTAVVQGDVETQRRGIVTIIYLVGRPFNGIFDMALSRRATDISSCSPIRLNSLHFCFEDPMIALLKPLGMLLIGKKHRLRIREYQGTNTECQYRLMTYGIPVHAFPVSPSGEISTRSWHQWVVHHMYQEEHLCRTGKAFEGIFLPSSKDILLRRGQIYNRHPGNIQYRMLIESKAELYTDARARDRAVLCREIVQTITSHQDHHGQDQAHYVSSSTPHDPVRFLKYETSKRSGGGLGWWFEVSSVEAAQRVAKTFRYVCSTLFQDRKKHSSSSALLPPSILSVSVMAHRRQTDSPSSSASKRLKK